MKQSIQLRLGQHLTMTPQLQQAIRLLQLSTLDLKQEIQDALDSNLMLEVEEERAPAPDKNDQPQAGEDAANQTTSNDANNEKEVNAAAETIPEELPVDTEWDDQYDIPITRTAAPSSENYDFLAQQSQPESLQDHLLWQLNLTRFSDIDRAIAMAIIDSIAPDGYLRATVADLLENIKQDVPEEEEVDEDQVLSVLHRIQRFDPPGIAARDPQECLLLQLEQLSGEKEPRKHQAIELLSEHFDLLIAANESKLCKVLKQSSDDIHEIILLIRSLNPRPGSGIASSATKYVEPDVFVQKKNGHWTVSLNGDTAPKLRINTEYATMIKRADNSTDNTTMKDHLQEARWFIKSLQSRNDTLLRVATKIVEYQQGYFEHGEEAMKPLVLRDIAEALEMHESTISRVTTQKYMLTPKGTLEFKYFFSSQLSTDNGENTSAVAIRAMLKKLIAAEPPGKPLSDNKIATLLADMGVKVARRTVAKYREAMAIPPSNERKRLI